MCGIAGIIDWEDNLLNADGIIQGMGQKLQNRGPDAKGTWVDKHIAFVHTRLIVIDPIGGTQPMVRKWGGKRYVIIYNGELYNTDLLRKELINRGHHFTTNSDTEVLLVSYIEWGEACVDHLNGIFAFAIYDEEKSSVYLARDRVGVKPLFYTKIENTFIFGSELKALLVHPLVKPEIDEEGLSEIFGLGPSRTPGNGVFKGILELKPGHFITYDRTGLRHKRYWGLVSKPHSDDLDTTIGNVKSLVFDAIEKQLVSDVPVCTFLSGGLDSSIISSIAARIYKDKGMSLDTYSVDYVGNKEYFKPGEFQPNSDGPWIRLMSETINSNHHNVLLDTSQLLEGLKDAVLAKDLPGMADVDSSLLLFSKEIKRKATVGLSGECADEIFGGYPWFYRQEDLSSHTFPWLRSINEREKILASDLRHTLNMKKYVERRYQETLDEVPRYHGDSREMNRMRELFYLNMTWFMSTLLDRKDRMTMATGLEVRVPFADHRIIEYLWNIPWEMKTIGGREKGLLRKAVEGLLPEEVVERKKSPYPKTHNPHYATVVSKGMLEILNDKASPINQLIDKDFVQNIVDSKGDSFKIPWFGQLMTGPQLIAYLIQINIWLKEYKVSIK